MRTVSFGGRLCNQLMVVVVPTNSGALGVIGLIDGETRVNDVSANAGLALGVASGDTDADGDGRPVGVHGHSVAVGRQPGATGKRRVRVEPEARR